MGSVAKNPGLPSNADAKAGPTRCVAMLGRFKGKQVPFGSRLLVTCKMDVHVVVEQVWGVRESTHLKNMLVKIGSFPQIGVKITHI